MTHHLCLGDPISHLSSQEITSCMIISKKQAAGTPPWEKKLGKKFTFGNSILTTLPYNIQAPCRQFSIILSLSSPLALSYQLKKMHLRVVNFLFGANEDYSPGDSISDSSEKLLQRGRGEGQYICDFGEGEVHVIKHIFFSEDFC